MKNTSVIFWSLCFVILGMSIFYYKWTYIGLPLIPNQKTEVWILQAKLSFKGNNKPVKVNFHIPHHTPGFEKIEEDMISSRYGLAIDKKQDNRLAEWAVRRGKKQETLYYRTTITRSLETVNWQEAPAFPEPPEYPEPFATAIQAILDDVRDESADISTYARELILRLNATEPDENIKLIKEQVNNPAEWVREIIHILKGVRIPGRMIWGVDISGSSNDLELIPKLQVYNGERWIHFDPYTAAVGVPENYFIWKVGDQPLYQVEGGDDLKISFSVTKSYQDIINIIHKKVSGKEFLSDFTLLSLPVNEQNVFGLLIMLPLGALLIVFFRTFIGVNTFGTFMPILIAIAFRETQLFWGVVMFTSIVFIGLIIRFYLENLMLLLVPRLASILILVVIMMLLVSFVSNSFDGERIVSIALFPMVIVAMTIERMSITWEESGAREAIQQGFGSLLIACLGYLVMTNEYLSYLFFVFPEFLFVILGLCLLMGRYTGYRLVELYRFRDLLR